MAPERLEAVYNKHPLVDQMFIYGNSLQSYLVAVVVANKEKFAEMKENKDDLMKGTFG